MAADFIVASRTPPVSSISRPRLCYATMRTQSVCLGAGPLPPWANDPFQSDTREAAKLIAVRTLAGRAPPRRPMDGPHRSPSPRQRTRHGKLSCKWHLPADFQPRGSASAALVSVLFAAPAM
jgi:hypothetical protein